MMICAVPSGSLTRLAFARSRTHFAQSSYVTFDNQRQILILPDGVSAPVSQYPTTVPIPMYPTVPLMRSYPSKCPPNAWFSRPRATVEPKAAQEAQFMRRSDRRSNPLSNPLHNPIQPPEPSPVENKPRPPP